MARVQEGIRIVRDFLERRASLEEFEDRSASYLRGEYSGSDVDALCLAQLIRATLNAFEDDSTDARLREELGALK